MESEQAPSTQQLVDCALIPQPSSGPPTGHPAARDRAFQHTELSPSFPSILGLVVITVMVSYPVFIPPPKSPLLEKKAVSESEKRLQSLLPLLGVSLESRFS